MPDEEERKSSKPRSVCDVVVLLQRSLAVTSQQRHTDMTKQRSYPKFTLSETMLFALRFIRKAHSISDKCESGTLIEKKSPFYSISGLMHCPVANSIIRKC
uniref:Uncharacterized protein n=1 Tax=Strigamia maritima TaxID=126957 RepID=T1JM72_STRMM